jgi:hypothetical protein
LHQSNPVPPTTERAVLDSILQGEEEDPQRIMRRIFKHKIFRHLRQFQYSTKVFYPPPKY